MKPEAQRIAIARACGKGQLVGQLGGLRRFVYSMSLDYLNDLNAMHEAEKALTPDQFYLYASKYLPDVAGDTHPVSATADQRAEAFLRTLDLWTE